MLTSVLRTADPAILVGGLIVIVLLVIRELVAYVPGRTAERLRMTLLIGIVPLLLAFSLILTVRILDILI